jgi:hypothetical protein
MRVLINRRVQTDELPNNLSHFLQSLMPALYGLNVQCRFPYFQQFTSLKLWNIHGLVLSYSRNFFYPFRFSFGLGPIFTGITFQYSIGITSIRNIKEIKSFNLVLMVYNILK